jgi:hypothetical protein
MHLQPWAPPHAGFARRDWRLPSQLRELIFVSSLIPTAPVADSDAKRRACRVWMLCGAFAHFENAKQGVTRAMKPIRFLFLAGLLGLGACTVPADTSTVVREDTTVARARVAMVGMSEADVRMCAGFPTLGVDISGAEKIWTYQRNYSRGTLNVGVTSVAVGSLPGLTGASGAGAEGFCNTQVRFANGKVTQIDFAGDNNTLSHLNGLCVSTIDNCVVYAKRKAAGQIPLSPPALAIGSPSPSSKTAASASAKSKSTPPSAAVSPQAK